MPATSLQPELFWLTLTCLLTGLLWLPYILQLIVQLGPVQAIWDPTGAHPHDADWALRAKRAHYNAVENLAVFAPLVLIVVLTGAESAVTSTATAAYFGLRVAHYLIHLAAVPVIRTVVFLGGWSCQMALGLSVLGLL